MATKTIGPNSSETLAQSVDHRWAEQMGVDMDMPKSVRTLKDRGVPLVVAARTSAGETQREFGTTGFTSPEHGPELLPVRGSFSEGNYEYAVDIGVVGDLGGRARLLIHAHPGPYYTPSSKSDQNIARGLTADGKGLNQYVPGGIWVITIRNGYIEVINPTGHINAEPINPVRN